MDVQAFSLKNGPTESGIGQVIGIRDRILKIIPEAVGGEVLPFNLIETLPSYWVFILAFFLPVLVLLYKKRDLALNFIAKII